MVRKNSSSCPKEGLKRGAWTSQEDELLSDYIGAHGLGRWRTLPANAGLNRCGKSCRLRWLNYLRPHIKRGNITEEEEELIIRLHKLLGNRWSLIAGRLPGRTDNEIKNYWNTHIRRKLLGGGCSSMSSKMNTKSAEPSSSTPQAAIAEEDQAAGKPVVNVIRTKAVRCTRTLFADPLPSSDPPAEYSQLAPELRGCSNNAAEDTDEPWMAELVQIPQLTDDSPYTSCSDSLHNNNNNNNVNVGVSFHEDEQYLGEWFGSEGDQGLYSLLDPDTWDTLTLTQNIHTTGEV